MNMGAAPFYGDARFPQPCSGKQSSACALHRARPDFNGVSPSRPSNDIFYRQGFTVLVCILAGKSHQLQRSGRLSWRASPSKPVKEAVIVVQAEAHRFSPLLSIQGREQDLDYAPAPWVL